MYFTIYTKNAFWSLDYFKSNLLSTGTGLSCSILMEANLTFLHKEKWAAWILKQPYESWSGQLCPEGTHLARISAFHKSWLLHTDWQHSCLWEQAKVTSDEYCCWQSSFSGAFVLRPITWPVFLLVTKQINYDSYFLS